MLIKGSTLLNRPLVLTENDQEKHFVDNILLNQYDFSLCYVVFEQKVLADEGRGAVSAPIDESVLNMQVATSGIGSQSTPLSGVGYPETSTSPRTEVRYVPWFNVVNIGESIEYKGYDQQIEEPKECISLTSFFGWSVENEAGEKIGKIKDIIIQTQDQVGVAFEITEGVFSTLFGEGHKYMKMNGVPKWAEQKWIVSSAWNGVLVKEVDDLYTL
ncbi:hypothetical protein A374_09768 [Fictibacillus macauensis ZFHKF-1]|uniref:PRC-barrel domain-containing protein n=1 Tax=Fictibacillus macauensis ZFHKF-1 TaxID=1196324 RepID=I8UF63_9BACL|nr:PRC-barrel domain-containing protein [Fictibacillus macauensis]EIT85515.1 hypothetical protein A374_09768 [Fictibacillus macauensis ZFHKF-1]